MEIIASWVSEICRFWSHLIQLHARRSSYLEDTFPSKSKTIIFETSREGISQLLLDEIRRTTRCYFYPTAILPAAHFLITLKPTRISMIADTIPSR